MAETEAPHHYKFGIQMNCGGCSGAIERVLKKMEGLLNRSTHDVADVYAEENLQYETVLEKIKKTGKEVKRGEKDGVVAEI